MAILLLLLNSNVRKVMQESYQTANPLFSLRAWVSKGLSTFQSSLQSPQRTGLEREDSGNMQSPFKLNVAIRKEEKIVCCLHRYAIELQLLPTRRQEKSNVDFEIPPLKETVVFKLS